MQLIFLNNSPAAMRGFVFITVSLAGGDTGHIETCENLKYTHCLLPVLFTAINP
jgi:hypothetical protein